ncbi:MAG: aminotransferase class I/II-fold pyridoxal phosphate-dependent enzyme [Elusimicrobia bacterium]|nr:aminotransferase class I/II-fold pyridoxal phosphate-dependent enzyme [Elusimicrobiota bacterium]MBD3411937.1 aminotransferase class I/II-fold pyridoxal phosphate-dependent enzyme [Elusimicrobiota bacterium]
MIQCSRKLSLLPPYIFSRIHDLTLKAYKEKKDVIDLSMGNPDMPTPKSVTERLCDTVLHHRRTHRYPQAKGMPKFRSTVARWVHKRFGVELDPEHEVLALIGSKEGGAHFLMAYLNPGDTVLVPDPSYPVHFNGVLLAGGNVETMPLIPERGYKPDLSSIHPETARKAKIMILNYPNNPTTGIVEDPGFFRDVVAFAKEYNILVCHDNAYSEITFDGYRAPSFLEVPGARDVGIEFHSFSKTFSMAGWRVGFAIGSAELLAPVTKFKAFVDYGVATFVQLSAVKALLDYDDIVPHIVQTYQRRRDRLVKGLQNLGWNIAKPKATMYVWASIPQEYHMDSLSFSEQLLKDTGVVVTPGIGFGPGGEGMVRFALVTHDNRFHDALLRIKKWSKKIIG